MEQRLQYIHCRYAACVLAWRPDSQADNQMQRWGKFISSPGILNINHFSTPMQFILLLSKCNSWKSHISVAVTCGRAEM